MAEVRHYRADALINSPRNWEDIEITFNWSEKNELEINVENLEFMGSEAVDIQKRILDGLNGGVGITEGEPYRIEFGEEGNPLLSIKGYLDFMSNSAFIGCNNASVSLKKEQGSDWLNDVADGFSFRYLHSIGVITNSDFVKVPYVKNYVPDEVQLTILALTFFITVKEGIELAYSIGESISEIVNSVTPNAGVGITWDIGDVIWVVMKTILRIAYAILIVIALKNLMIEIFEQLAPKKRFHLGMRFNTLFEKACNHLGLAFESDLLYNTDRRDWVCIPSKTHKGGEPQKDENGNQLPELGCPSLGDNIDKFGDLIRWFKRSFNADYAISNGTFRIDRKDFLKNQSGYTIPDVWTDQKKQIDVMRFNVDEIKGNYSISWAYDNLDMNTLDKTNGSQFQGILEQIVTVDKKYQNIKGLEEIDLGMSMGLRKDDLTKIESTLKKIAQAVDALTAALGSGTNLVNKIEARIGSLLLSDHNTTIPKVVVMEGDKLKYDQRFYLSATRFWNELHYINSFVEESGIHNQWWIPDTIKAKVCEEDIALLMESNYCKTKDAKEAKIDKLAWRPYYNSGDISYRVNEKYTNNLKIKKISI